jgi:predicted NodU family carbamoyl transferase
VADELAAATEEPIVGSPADAISELERNPVDVLFLKDYEVMAG